MTHPQLAKDWNISPNLRRPYTTMSDMTGWFLYSNKNALVEAGWVVKFSCDGTTGPSGPLDDTDRWLSVADVKVRGNGSSLPQSYCVLQNTEGLQILFSFDGSVDDIGKISYSSGGLFSLASPSTWQPTASDELIALGNRSLVHNITLYDRVMTIWASTDTTQWSCFIASNNLFTRTTGIEKITNHCGPGVFDVPYVGYSFSNTDKTNGPNSGTPAGSIYQDYDAYGANSRVCARVFTDSIYRIISVGGGGINVSGEADGADRTNSSVFFKSPYPALQGGDRSPCYQFFWSGYRLLYKDGILGSPIDWWICHTSASKIPSSGSSISGYDVGDIPGVDPIRKNWLITIGTEMIRPWKDADTTLMLS